MSWSAVANHAWRFSVVILIRQMSMLQDKEGGVVVSLEFFLSTWQNLLPFLAATYNSTGYIVFRFYVDVTQ